MGRFCAPCILLMACAMLASAQTTATPDPCARQRALAARLESLLKDFGALSRYRESNARLAAPPADELRVVFMGDSITDSWDDPTNGGFFPGKPFINRGIGGQTTPQMLIRFRPDVIALRPKVVVILAGTNDITGDMGRATLDAVRDNLTSMAELALAHGIRVVLASILPINDYAKTKGGNPIVRSAQRNPAQITALNEWMKTYAAEYGLTYLDYYSAMVDGKGFLKSELSNDGLHPNRKGYAVMLPLAEQAINSALKK
jgi:lysophospholipase L1-like esterase